MNGEKSLQHPFIVVLWYTIYGRIYKIIRCARIKTVIGNERWVDCAIVNIDVRIEFRKR